MERTQIFARDLADGRQVLVYSMVYAVNVDVAMIVPLPTPAAPAEDAVRFVDLSSYEKFFGALEQGFPEMPEEEGLVLMGRKIEQPKRRPLEVHSVGSFEASFVPTVGDFSRLDARFRLPDGVLELLPIYRDYSFAVFKLKPGRTQVHPMAFTFPRRNAGELFFPTVHVHDGTVPGEADFDHALYCQSQGDTALPGWELSHTWQMANDANCYDAWFERYAAGQGRAAASYGDDEKSRIKKREGPRGYVRVPANAFQFMDVQRTKGLVLDKVPVGRMQMHGLRPNRDTVVPLGGRA